MDDGQWQYLTWPFGSGELKNDENVTCRCITSTLSCSEGECDGCFTPRFDLWCLTPLNNISVISWRSVLLVEETVVPPENYRPVVSN
jgi:hypothetical protein